MAARLHFLDWLRFILVCCVVYAHVTFCGLNQDFFNWKPTPDNRDYDLEDPSAFRVRWNSIARQWVIPLLFWISGAASALTFTPNCAKFAKNLGKFAFFTVIGVIANGTMWQLGPRNENCSMYQILHNVTAKASCKGSLFDFTEDPWSGNVEPFFNQMWYTFALIILLSLNWPLFRVLAQQGGYLNLVPQWVATMLVYGLLTWATGDECPGPTALMAWLLVTEAALLAIAPLSVPASCPSWFPPRLAHYACAAVAVVQLAVPVFAHKFTDMTVGYMFFLAVGCNKWFQLGGIMTRARKDRIWGDEDGVKPLVSRAWPFVVILAVLCAPSTNWNYDGVITYPYRVRIVDRVLYTSGTALMVFVLDRTSRTTECIPLPGVLSWTSLVLYLFQIVLITVLMQLGLRSVEAIALVAMLIAFLLTSITMLIWRAIFGQSQNCDMLGRRPETCVAMVESFPESAP